MKLVTLLSSVDLCKVEILDYYRNEPGTEDPLRYAEWVDMKSPLEHITEWAEVKDYLVRFITCCDDYIYIYVENPELKGRII